MGGRVVLRCMSANIQAASKEATLSWQEYLDHGWKLTEIKPGSKSPRNLGWQERDAPFNAAARGAGLCHAWSGTCSIDIDDLALAEKWLEARGVDLAALLSAPDAVRIESGKPNRAKLLYALSSPIRSKKVVENKLNIIDFRGATAEGLSVQDVLPPTMHPETGRPYAWAYGDAALGHWSQIPPLPASLEALWRALIGPTPEGPAVKTNGAGAISVANLEAWLATKDPDMDRDAWVAVGMRVHEATNGQGFYLWDNWSRKGEKYKGSHDLQAPWRSFHVGGGLGIGQILADKVADMADFPVEEVSEFEPSIEPTDNTVFAQAYRLLQPRLVYLTAQGRFWGQPAEPRIDKLDRHLGGPMKREDLASMFERWMPSTRSSNGKEFRQKPLEFWNRHITNPLMARAPNFNPGGGTIFTDRDGYDYVNTYKPYVVQPLAPRPNELEAWDWLWCRIEDEAYRRWLKQFFAFILLNPGAKVTAAPLLYGDPGTGKSTLMKRVPELLYGTRNVHLMSNKVLRSQFSDALTGTWFLVLDELKTDGGKQDRVELANEMKPWITEPELQIHPKGLPPYYVTNRLQLTATSNNDDAVHITRDDRRWAVCEMGGGPMTAQQKLDLYDGFLETDRAPGVLRWFMERVDLVGFTRTTQAPDTAGRREMVRASLGMWESKLAEAATAGDAPFDRDAFRATDIRETLMGMNAPNVYRINSVLRKAGIPTKTTHTERGNIIVWQNIDHWRQAGNAALLRHIETGERPVGFSWTREIPIAIRRLAGDDDGTDPNADLLGNVNG
jgi:Family of unknown function (DUF5906)/Bifunctional DNA primase/polymerase, N-terminal/Primase C terminal 2 (PriCT-2)